MYCSLGIDVDGVDGRARSPGASLTAAMMTGSGMHGANQDMTACIATQPARRICAALAGGVGVVKENLWVLNDASNVCLSDETRNSWLLAMCGASSRGRLGPKIWAGRTDTLAAVDFTKSNSHEQDMTLTYHRSPHRETVACSSARTDDDLAQKNKR